MKHLILASALVAASAFGAAAQDASIALSSVVQTKILELAPGADLTNLTAAQYARLTQVGAVTGTPAYMAPEQWEGREAEAAADQFGWSVMAWELLYGERPFAAPTLIKLAAVVLAGPRSPPPRGRRVPGWLHRVLVRGLAPAPEQRFPDMAALLAALTRGRARARLRLAALGLAGLALAALAVLAVGRIDRMQRLAACERAGASISEVWNDDARARLHAAFLATGVAGADTTVAKLLPWLDRQAEAWRAARTEVCHHADLARDWDPATLDRALWCLDDRRSDLAAQVRELADADASAVHRAVPAVSRVTIDGRCSDAAWLQRQPSPPTRGRAELITTRAALSRVESLHYAGKYADALARIAEAETDAPTPVCLTQHAYFNLDAEHADVRDHTSDPC